MFTLTLTQAKMLQFYVVLVNEVNMPRKNFVNHVDISVKPE